MLAQIRAFAKSPIATMLFGLLIVSFVGWGVHDVFRTTSFTDSVVEAGGRLPISPPQFKEMFNRAKAAQEQKAGQPIPLEDAVKFGMDRSLVDELAATEAVGALMSSEGLNPSDTLVAGEIRKIPRFFNPVSGQFDPQLYREALAEAKLTEAQADAQFRDTVMQRHYLIGMAAGLKAPRIYSLIPAAVEREGRDFTWFALDPKSVEQPPKPTDAELQAFIKENAAQLTRPETRQLSIVRFSAAGLAQTLTAPDAEVQKRYNFEKDTLSTPEKRALVQIPVKDAKTAADVAAKLNAGDDPKAVAKAIGASPVVYPPTPKGAIADRKVADTAFGLKAGEVSGPVQGDLGLAVIKVTEATPAKIVTLEEARPKIETEVKNELAKEKIYEVVQKYEDAHSGGAGMAAAAKAAGQSVVTVPAPLRADGTTLEGQRANIPPKVLQSAFTLPQGGESDVTDLGQGEYWVIHVDKINPSALVGLDEKIGNTTVREAVTRQVTLQALFKRLKAKADALTAEIAKGKSLDAAAAEVGAKVVQATNVARSASRPTAPGQPPAYSADLLGRVFAAKVGDVVTGQDTKLGLVIAKVTKVQEPPPPVLAGVAAMTSSQTSRSLFGDMEAALRLAALNKIKPKVDYKRARSALGLDPEAGPAPAKPKS